MRLAFERPPVTEFEQRVHRFVQSLPRGRVATYGDVAAAVGRPRAARAVGNVMRSTPAGFPTPCHRVVNSDGTVGGWGDGRPGSNEKVRRLKKEGVRVDRRGALVDFERVRWRGR